MPIFGNQVSIIVDGFLDILDVFSCSAQNLLVKNISIRKDSLVNNFGISVRKFDDEVNRTFSLW